ncbi:hypothetical protein JHK87_002424 [Glycine soja]|nr:hypothetical protein JHK87_002424 [Glycine soja]
MPPADLRPLLPRHPLWQRCLRPGPERPRHVQAPLPQRNSQQHQHRLYARTVFVILRHVNSALVFVDCASCHLVLEALSLFLENQNQRPTLILLTDKIVEKEKASPAVHNFLDIDEGLE